MDVVGTVVVAGLLGLAVLNFYIFRAVSRRIDPAPPLADPDTLEALWKSLEGLEKRTLENAAQLRLAVSDGIERVARAEKRIQKTVTSARRAIRDAGLEHAGIEAEHDELQPRDDEPSRADSVLPLYEEVEAPAYSGIPGLSGAELQEIRSRLNV